MIFVGISLGQMLRPSQVRAYIKEVVAEGGRNPTTVLFSHQAVGDYRLGHFLIKKEVPQAPSTRVGKVLEFPERLFNYPINLASKYFYGQEYDANFFFLGGVDHWVYEKWIGLGLDNSKLRRSGQERQLRPVARLAVDVPLWMGLQNYYSYLDRCHGLPDFNIPMLGAFGVEPREEGIAQRGSWRPLRNESPKNYFADSAKTTLPSGAAESLRYWIPPSERKTKPVPEEIRAQMIENAKFMNPDTLPCDTRFWEELIETDPRYFKIKEKLASPEAKAAGFGLPQAITEAFVTREAYNDFFNRYRKVILAAEKKSWGASQKVDLFRETFSDLLIHSPFFAELRASLPRDEKGQLYLGAQELARVEKRIQFLSLMEEVPQIIERLQNGKNISLRPQAGGPQKIESDVDQILAASFDAIFTDYEIGGRQVRFSFYEHPNVKMILQKLREPKNPQARYEAGRDLTLFLSAIEQRLDQSLRK